MKEWAESGQSTQPAYELSADRNSANAVVTSRESRVSIPNRRNASSRLKISAAILGVGLIASTFAMACKESGAETTFTPIYDANCEYVINAISVGFEPDKIIDSEKGTLTGDMQAILDKYEAKRVYEYLLLSEGGQIISTNPDNIEALKDDLLASSGVIFVEPVPVVADVPAGDKPNCTPEAQ